MRFVYACDKTVLDHRDVVSNELFQFIEEALESSESVLVHSVRGQSRSCCVLAAYLMKKYNWCLRKTMEFLQARRPDVSLKSAFTQQLTSFERRLMQNSKVTLSTDWNNVINLTDRSEELILRNTYINSQMGPLANFNEPGLKPHVRRLQWTDAEMDDRSKLERPSGSERWYAKPDANGVVVPNKGLLKIPPGFFNKDKNVQQAQPAPALETSNIPVENSTAATPTKDVEKESSNRPTTASSDVIHQENSARAAAAAAAAEREKERQLEQQWEKERVEQKIR